MTPYWATWIHALGMRQAAMPDLMRDVLRKEAAQWGIQPRSDRISRAPDWAKLLALDFGAECERIRRNLEVVFTTTPPPPDVTGLFFRLVYPSRESPDQTVGLGVTGSRQYGDHDWARDFHWVPEGEYQDSAVLTALWQTLLDAPNDIGTERDRALFVCYQFAALMVAEWRNGPSWQTLIGPAPHRAIFVGLDPWMGITLHSIATPPPPLP